MPASATKSAALPSAPRPSSPAVSRAPASSGAAAASGAPLVRLDTSRGAGGSAPGAVRDLLARDGGAPLAAPVRSPIERSIGVDLGAVRVHSGGDAAAVVRAQGARAFTLGQHVFLGPGERADDLPLMAHEVTHVVQQNGGGALAVQAMTEAGATSDTYEREAHHVASAVVSGEPAVVRERTSPRPQHLFGWAKKAIHAVGSAVTAVAEAVGDIIGVALDFVRDHARVIPGYDMLGFILGRDPITQKPVERTAVNLIKAVMGLWPGGSLIFDALQKYGIIDKVGAWLSKQLDALISVVSGIGTALDKFLHSLGAKDLLDLGGAWDRAKAIFTVPIDNAIKFVKGLVTSVLEAIRDAILLPIAKLAQGTKGYDLLCAVLGKDPITGKPVPRDATTLIGGFMKLIGQEEIWENMQKSKAVPRAFAWFKTAMAELMAFVESIPPTFISTLKSLEIADLVLIPRAFIKVGKVFLSVAGKFFSWAGGTIWKLLEIIFEVVSPKALEYIRKTGSALKSILKNPLPFMGNLVKAAKLGFTNFADHFVDHLKNGLIDWLTGSLPGVYIPKAFSLGEIVKFVFSVLGLSWANIRAKLVKVVGETAVKAMETGFDIVVTLVTQGPAAAWDKIKEQLATLQDQVISGIIGLVVDAVVKKAIPKLIAMFIPGAGFISAIIAIYDTVMVFVEKIAKIIQVVTAFIDSIVNIAAGAIDGAAKKVEGILANLLSLAISFLAGFAGLGKIADKIMGVIMKVRDVVDKGIDALINWIVTMAKKLFAKVFGKNKDDKRTDAEKLADLQKAKADVERLQKQKGMTEEGLRKALPAIKERYKLTGLEVVVDTKDKNKEKVHVHASINPELDTASTDVAQGGALDQIKQDLKTLPEGVTDSSLSGFFDQEMTALADRGLTSLELRPESDTVASIIGTASPETILEYVVANDIQLPDYGAVTAVVAIDHIPRGDFRNRDGQHAEEGLIDFTDRTIRSHIATAGPPKLVEILVSQSPCRNRCTPQLVDMRAAYPGTQFVLYYNTLYGGTGGKQYEDSLRAINRLRANGWRVFIWNKGKILSGVKKRR